MQRIVLLLVTLPALLLTQIPPAAAADPAGGQRDWQKQLADRLPAFGHRNWIVVADMAYPAQSREGIETVYIGGDQLAAVKKVLSAVDAAPHVRGVIYVDQELKSVADADAPGVDSYRGALDGLLEGRPVSKLPHEEIIGKLDEAAKTFRILVLKTDMTLPYTSVFVQLDCGYWSAEKEKRLRERLGEQ